MRIHAIRAQTPLERHLDEILASRNPGNWRCLYTELDPELYRDPYAHRIVLNFIADHYQDYDVDEFAFYWLKTGHVFLLFQGRVTNAKSRFEKFIAFVSEGESEATPVFYLCDMGREAVWVQDAFEAARSKIDAESDASYHNKQQHEQKQKYTKQGAKKFDKGHKNDDRAIRSKPIALVVEDERMSQAFIESMLAPHCEVLVAGTIQEGRKLYEETWPDMTFLDIQLPDGDGQDFAGELARIDPKAYIVMVSGNISADSIAKCRAIGANDFVAKPVIRSRERLLAIVHNYIRQRDIS